MEVEKCNNSRLNALEGPEHIYKSMDSAGYNVQHLPISKDSAETLLDRLVSVSKITLKVRALDPLTYIAFDGTMAYYFRLGHK